MSDGPWWALRCCCLSDGGCEFCPLHFNPAGGNSSEQCHVFPVIIVPGFDLNAIGVGPNCIAYSLGGWGGTYINPVALSQGAATGCGWVWSPRLPDNIQWTDTRINVGVSSSGAVSVVLANAYHQVSYIRPDVFSGDLPWNFLDAGSITVPYAGMVWATGYQNFLGDCDFTGIQPVTVSFYTP